MIFFRVVSFLAISAGFWCATPGSSETRTVAQDEFAGSIPCDDSLRDFVGGISNNIPCHCITWHLTLSTNLNSNQRTTYRLVAQYGLKGKTDPNQLEDGPMVELEGEWEIAHGNKTNSRAVVCRLFRTGEEESVSLMRIGENLLHFLSEDKNLQIGNAGWSYTLNRKGVVYAAPLSTKVTNPADANASTNFWRQSPRQGPEIHAYFEGRSPCREISRLLNVPKSDDCIKIKWQLILYQDPVTHAPTTYALGGLAWRNPPKTGEWAIVKGTKEDPDAVVYQLDPDDANGFLAFLRGDENILFFLGNNRELLVGNEHFSYTLNRPPNK